MTAANGHIELSAAETEQMQEILRCAMVEVLRALRIDPTDPNVVDTPSRWSRMLVREVLAGRFTARPNVTTFPNTRNVDEVIAVGPINVRSMCSHHFVPIVGHAWIGLIPGTTLLGLSKYVRLSRWVFARPQIQEEACAQLADELEAVLSPRALGVVVRASHLCMTWRGVLEPEAVMVSSVMRGIFRESVGARAELMQALRTKGL